MLLRTNILSFDFYSKLVQTFLHISFNFVQNEFYALSEFRVCGAQKDQKRPAVIGRYGTHVCGLTGWHPTTLHLIRRQWLWHISWFTNSSCSRILVIFVWSQLLQCATLCRRLILCPFKLRFTFRSAVVFKHFHIPVVQRVRFLLVQETGNHGLELNLKV